MQYKLKLNIVAAIFDFFLSMPLNLTQFDFFTIVSAFCGTTYWDGMVV